VKKKGENSCGGERVFHIYIQRMVKVLGSSPEGYEELSSIESRNNNRHRYLESVSFHTSFTLIHIHISFLLLLLFS